MSSRLFQEVRERQALAYSVHSGLQSYRDTGLFYIYAGTDAANFAKVVKALMKEVRALKKDGVQAEELARSKEHLKGSLMLSLESTSSRMNRLAKQELRFGTFPSLDEMLSAIDAVHPSDVEAMISRTLDEDQLALLTLGPIDRRNLPRELLNA
jgi:predicted Zn-dependent peptidase